MPPAAQSGEFGPHHQASFFQAALAIGLVMALSPCSVPMFSPPFEAVWAASSVSTNAFWGRSYQWVATPAR